MTTTTRRHLLALFPALALLPWVKPQTVEAAPEPEPEPNWTLFGDFVPPAEPTITVWDFHDIMQARRQCFAQGGLSFVWEGGNSWTCRVDDTLWIGSTGV